MADQYSFMRQLHEMIEREGVTVSDVLHFLEEDAAAIAEDLEIAHEQFETGATRAKIREWKEVSKALGRLSDKVHALTRG